MKFKVGVLVYHKTLGHKKLEAQTRESNILLWGVRISPNEVTFDREENFSLSCLNFMPGQAIKYNAGSFIITALEEANNRVVVKTFNTTNGSQRYALVPGKCKVEKAQQLRVVVVNEHNEIIKEMKNYGMEPPSKKRYTAPRVRDQQSSKYVRLAYINDEEVSNALTKQQVWDRLIMEEEAIFVFDMLTTKCYVYTIEYYEAHPELREKHNKTYL